MWTKLVQLRPLTPTVLAILGMVSLLLPGVARAQGMETQPEGTDGNRFNSPIDQLNRLDGQQMGDPYDLLRPPAANPGLQGNDRRPEFDRPNPNDYPLQNHPQPPSEADQSFNFRESSLTNQNPTPSLMRPR